MASLRFSVGMILKLAISLINPKKYRVLAGIITDINGK